MAPKAQSTTGAKKRPFNMRTKSGASSNPMRGTEGVRQRGGNLRDKATIKRLNMYKGGKPIRNSDGKIIGGTFMMDDRAGDAPITAASGRVAPDRRWFGNTRVIGQGELDRFREEMTTRAADPFSVVLKRKKLPMSLLQEPSKIQKANLLQTESYEDVLSSKRSRKRPKLDAGDMESLLARASQKQEAYGEGEKDSNVETSMDYRVEKRDCLFEKGQSRRIWGELYKVLDCSDVVIQVLDARNVPGTRCEHLERHLAKNAPHKHLVFVINKVDLVPTWVTKKWVRLLGQKTPTLAFHASITNSFGKGALINLLRQFSKLHSDKKQISVGIVGYPNVGKSSLINTIKTKKVCRVAPIPGETKVWQYIALMKRIFVIDCPGVVYDIGDDETEIVLKGAVRAEKLPDPTDFAAPILARAKAEHLKRLYGVGDWENAEEFLGLVARRSGRLLPGGEPDLNCAAVNLVNDWQRGKIPYFVPPPLAPGETPAAVAKAPNQRIIIGPDGKVTQEDEKPSAPKGKAVPGTDATADAGELDEVSEDDEEDDDEEGDEEDGSDAQDSDESGGGGGGANDGENDNEADDNEVEGGEDDDEEVEGSSAQHDADAAEPNTETAAAAAAAATVSTDLQWEDDDE
eukprot:TRINITY_DN745_c2_g1_i1.p1 TRINITY_DN745_c2_g1~~TRINITY_DN745_c2_g1_i1.p1  ORF type:complete len:658 (-),score=211.32 TRINITY_DN745_c2_g1_i1:584-2473(-)